MTSIPAPTIASAAPPAALSLRHVHFGYERDQPILCDISASLTPGRITILLGPNAAGKSTLVKLMLGQLEPWQGEVTLADWPVSSLCATERARAISYVPQGGGTPFFFTVRQIVEMGRFSHRNVQPAVDEALALTDLDGLAHRIMSHLSGGQQQRVLLARAIAQSRDTGQAMLLDEPAASMDLWHVHRMMRNLRNLADGGLAVLAVLHDLNLAARYADDVWLMDHGCMIAAGPWDQVLRPELLEPVYRVKLRAIQTGDDADRRGDDRPVFLVEPTSG